MLLKVLPAQLVSMSISGACIISVSPSGILDSPPMEGLCWI